MNIKFTRDKTTKNTVRFTATGTKVSGSLYIPKGSKLAKDSSITVEVSQPSKV